MHGDILKVGKDFADAVSGKLKSQGKIETSARRDYAITWVSTLDCIMSERALRRAVKNERREVTYFESQAL